MVSTLYPASARPAEVCAALLAALEAAEGRRRSRKRDQTPDGIGLAIKRDLLQRAVRENPNPEAFEKWLLHCVLPCGSTESSGAVSAMARAIFEEWKLVHSMNEFKNWLERGAPSEDAGEKKRTFCKARARMTSKSAPAIILAGGKSSRMGDPKRSA